ncbi:DUF7882 family protein [Herbiconiux daphne]|uniref:ATP-dependent DNA ligase n=1 Tax=Herbiconiux daphne TaxID=2970914 RepID=A0ABT2GX00_9MICO|nr:ATP-dependent DNA ligase [Herbiconiux daphne]MCS5732483.1 ATP-dependent DNA ligase [Herbiconiux daphne]
MGYLHIGTSGWSIQVDDRALAHLKIVILTELRKGHGIAFSCKHPADQGSGRETFWINPNTDLRFQFFGGRAPSINRCWLQQMHESCVAGTGLYIMEEPLQLQRVSA